MAATDHAIRVKADKNRVFEALATTEGLKGWYTPHIDGEVVQGAEAVFRFTDREPFRWKFVELSPGHSARWECVEGPGAAAGTTVAFQLADGGEGKTRVTCTHEGWPESHEAMAICNTLWGDLMTHLRDYVESGKTAPAFG